MKQRRTRDGRILERRELQLAGARLRPLAGQPVRRRPLVLPSNALALQRLAGNRAVAGALGATSDPAVVQRWSLDDITAGIADVAGRAWSGASSILERAAEIEKKSASATGKQANAYLSATPLIRRYVKAQVDERALTVAGSIRFDDDVTFESAYIADSLKRSELEGDAEVERVDQLIERLKSVTAFTGLDDVIHVRKDRARAGTVLHESLHLYSPDGLRDTAGKRANEGVTEYFTRIVCRTNGILRHSVYDKELAAVTKLVSRLPGGEEVLADAYFGGDADLLRPAFEPRSGSPTEVDGGGRFELWCKRMKANKFVQAGELLD